MTTLQAIDARLARYRALIDELTALRAEVADSVPAVETRDVPPGKAPAPARPVAPRAKPPAAGAHEPRSMYMRPVLSALAAGPLTAAEIAERIGKDSGLLAGPAQAVPVVPGGADGRARRPAQPDPVGADGPRPVHARICRHCRRPSVNRPRGLCWTCYYEPGVRDLFPVTSKYAPLATRGEGDRGPSDEELDALCAAEPLPELPPEPRPPLDGPARRTGLRPRTGYVLHPDTAAPAIAAGHRAEVEEYRAAHPGASVEEVAAALVLPTWNVERALLPPGAPVRYRERAPKPKSSDRNRPTGGES